MSLVQRVIRWIIAPVEHVALQVPRALIVSAAAAALDVGVLALLVESAHLPAVAAATISYLLGGVLQYVLCTIWVFSISPGNALVSFITFSLLSLVGLAITDGAIWALHTRLGWHYLLGKIVALFLAFCWNFASRKYLIFRDRRPACPVETPTAVIDHHA